MSRRSRIGWLPFKLRTDPRSVFRCSRRLHFEPLEDRRLMSASGPGGNPKVGSRPWVDALDVEETGTPGVYTMDTARQVTTNLFGATSGTGTVVTGPLDPIGDAAINDAHGFTELTLNMLDEWFGYDSIDDAGFKIRSAVHYGTNYAGAFWDYSGMQTYFGDGRTDLPSQNQHYYALSGGIDVVAHELAHGFTQFHSNLEHGIGTQAAALNESFSDVVGTLAEYYVEGLAADFTIAEDVKVIGYLRSMSDPTSDGNSMDDAITYIDGLNPHFTNGVTNKAFVRTALRLSSGSPTGPATIEGVRRAADAWFLANESYWTSGTDYVQGGQGVYDAAEALGFTTEELVAIRDSWADVGVFFEGGIRQHDELLTNASGTITSPNFPANYSNNYKHTWAIDPPGPAPVTLTFSSFATGLNADFVEVRDATGTLLGRASGNNPPLPTTSTRLLVTFATNAEITRSGWSASWTSPVIAAGDYDVDGDVDGFDYDFWKANFGATSGPGLFADGNGNGIVDRGDYTVWRNHLGSGAGAGTGARDRIRPTAPGSAGGRRSGSVSDRPRASQTPGKAGGCRADWCVTSATR